MGKAPETIEVQVSLHSGAGAVAALDEAIAELASTLAAIVSERAYATTLVEHIERLGAVRGSIVGAANG